MSLFRRVFFGATVMLLAACQSSSDQPTSLPDSPDLPETPSVSGSFDADSAYAFVARQVSFGPRVPGSAAHRACGDWLESKLRRWADEVEVQEGSLEAWNGDQLPMRNIIARFEPSAARRLLFCAHWDTRPWADEDADASRQQEPIIGANDGGSGVGVLLELARQLSLNAPGVGVDIVLFDVEDYGNSDVRDSYCLGSQHWAESVKGSANRPEFGVLLDMVGARGAYFYKEGISMHFAPDVVAKVWDAAADAGARSWFIYNEAPFPQLTDDHLYVNTIAGIPCIDIIQYDQDTPRGFGDFWHTHQDDMSIIDARTLGAVGKTLVRLLVAESRY